MDDTHALCNPYVGNGSMAYAGITIVAENCSIELDDVNDLILSAAHMIFGQARAVEDCDHSKESLPQWGEQNFDG